jgi:hypothetical protein
MKLSIAQLNKLRKKNPKALRKYQKNQRCSHPIGRNGTCRMCGLEGVEEDNVSWDRRVRRIRHG